MGGHPQGSTPAEIYEQYLGPTMHNSRYCEQRRRYPRLLNWMQPRALHSWRQLPERHRRLQNVIGMETR